MVIRDLASTVAAAAAAPEACQPASWTDAEAHCSEFLSAEEALRSALGSNMEQQGWPSTLASMLCPPSSLLLAAAAADRAAPC
eukprot:SAG31_NODE_1491_length_8133_cov_8.084267_2_plen_83_part_00